ncbi:MAG: hypothetical protein WCC22_13880 [Terriglobales bacterium]
MRDVFQGDLLAEETHSGRAWSLIILLALMGPVIGAAMVPSIAGRWAVALVGVLAIGIFAMAWSGFQYRFLWHGVEIRMLGLRLRSIPKQSIVSYSIEPWAFIRGYGIRGIGNTRAYVWCNKVVHIRTANGEVFLGHNDPERIVRDLDLVTGFVTRG